MKRVAVFWLMLAAALGAFALPRVSLLTAMPGGEIYELEGHTGLRVSDPESGSDVVVNWGIFDFNSPGFVYRFCKGETDYLCVASPTEWFLEDYRRQGRQVVEQTLSLDSVQTVRLLEMLADNLRPANRVYRYNYVKDNCATRPLLMLEAALGHKLVAQGGEPTTFRKEMTAYHKQFPWYQFGIDLALGRGIDRTIGRREAVFAPVRLMAELDGNPAVMQTVSHGEQTLTNSPTPALLTPMAVAVLILLLALAVTFFGSAAVCRTFDSVLFGVMGLLGCVIFFLVFYSSHEATSPNLLLLWLNPLCLAGAVLPWIKSAKKVKNCYFFANFALIILLAVLAPTLGRAMNAAFWSLMAADIVRSLANIKRICPNRSRT